MNASLSSWPVCMSSMLVPQMPTRNSHRMDVGGLKYEHTASRGVRASGDNTGISVKAGVNVKLCKKNCGVMTVDFYTMDFGKDVIPGLSHAENL